jgi:hypothetical protein
VRRSASRPSVLVLDAGSPWGRSSLATVRALHSGGYLPVVGRSDGHPSLATVSRFCSSVVTLPEADQQEYASAVADEVAAHRHVTSLAASDAVLVAQRAPGAHLTDKSVVSRRAAAAGLPTLPEVVVSDPAGLPDALRVVTWPVIVKPLVRHSGDAAVREVGSLDELMPLVHGRPVLVQARHDGELTAVSGVVFDGEIRAVVAQRSLRLWPTRAGTTCWGVSVEPDPLRVEALAEIVADHEGVFQAQFVGPYLVDINPRVYGSLPLAVAAGVNLPSIYCALLEGRTVPRTVGRAGVTYRWIEGDVRHALAAHRAHCLPWTEVARQLRPHAGTVHSVVQRSDPRPMLLRARFVVKELSPW